MNHRKTGALIPTALFLGAAFFCSASPASAEEGGSIPAAETAAAPVQDEQLVYYEPEGSSFLGYRFVSTEDSLKAAEYLDPHSSVTFGVDFLSCPLPYRYHLNAEYLSKHDYYADAGFAYKDIVLFRDILVGLHHNLDHYNYLFPGEPPGLIYDDRDLADEYFIDYANNQMLLRFKAPDYPFHTFFKHRYLERDGNVEQRFLLGDFDNINKTSVSRDINWRSNAYKIGLNSHLGPVEVEYALDQSQFDPGGNSILYDSYPESTLFSRPDDVYPHNVNPETKSSANTLKFHSSYTGGIVASATIGNLYQKNDFSQAESTTWKGAFDFSWLPDPLLGLFFKYRHRDVDRDHGDIVLLSGLNNALLYRVRDSISYTKDVFSLSAKYNPLTRYSLLTTYEYSRQERTDIDEWEVFEERTNVHNINVTANAKPFNKLKLKAIYDYTHYDDPAYNIDPDNANELRLTANYLPVPWLNAYLDYNLTVTERSDLHYLNPEPFTVVEGGDRDGRRDQFLASLSFMLSPKVTLTGSWSYNRWDVEQDLAYGKWTSDGFGDLPFIDYAVPYTDAANSFSVSCNYLPREDITLTADATYTLADGEYVTGDLLDGSLSDVDSYSTLEATETILSLGIAKKLPRDWEVRLKFYVDIYNDRTADVLDGDVYVTTFNLKRYF
jgi:hypothetical protein